MRWVSGHERPGVHHGGHDVGHDGVEKGGDHEGLNHASRKVRFRVHDFATDGSDFDGPGKGDEHEGGCRPHAQSDGLEVFDGSAKVEVGGEQGHNAQHNNHGHGARDDGNLYFFDGFHAGQVHEEDERQEHHRNGVRVDVFNAVMVGDHFHVGCETNEGKGRFQHKRGKQTQSADGANEVAIGAFSVNIEPP